MGPKKLGPVIDPDRPIDLPDGYKKMFSWRVRQANKLVLLPTIHQGNKGYCWTYAFNRLLAAHFYIHDKTRILLNLSPKHLFAHIEERYETGFLKNYKGVKPFLRDEGLIKDDECKCIVGKDAKDISSASCDRVKDRKVFTISEFVVVDKNIDEKTVIELLRTRGLVACEIQVTDRYKDIKKSEMYFGPQRKNLELENHIILLSAYGTDEKGIHYFEYQNTWGLTWGGDGGFGRFARKVSLPKGSQSLIKSYMYPILREQPFDV